VSYFYVNRDNEQKRSRYKEHRANALALRADEGRGKLRKATGNCKQVPIRRYPNEETHIWRTVCNV